MPFGPMTKAPGVPAMLPDSRTGTSSKPRLMASVNASSICDCLRSGPEDAQVRDDAAAAADERHGLLRGEVPFLVERPLRRQLVARAEQHVEVLAADVHVPRGGVHDERRSGTLAAVGPEARGTTSRTTCFDDGRGRSPRRTASGHGLLRQVPPRRASNGSAVARATMRSSSAGTTRTGDARRAATRSWPRRAPLRVDGRRRGRCRIRSRPGADAGADRGAVLADAAGEGQDVEAAELHEEGADVVADGAYEDVEREARARVARRRRLVEVADVAAEAADAGEPGLTWRAPAPCSSTIEAALLHDEQRGEDVEVAACGCSAAGPTAATCRSSCRWRRRRASPRRWSCRRGDRRCAARAAPSTAWARSFAARWLAPWNP